MVQKPERPRPGRPSSDDPKTARGGKGRQLSANISQGLRERLEAEAERTGRSISLVAERWLDQASQGHAQYDQLLGGMYARLAIERLAKIARAVEERLEDKIWIDVALLEAWRIALPATLSETVSQLRDADIFHSAANVWRACRQVLDVLVKAPESDPVLQRARLPLTDGRGVIDLPPLANRLSDALVGADGRLPDRKTTLALEELQAAGNTAGPEVEAALAVMRRFQTSLGKRNQAYEAAVNIGEAVGRAASEKPHPPSDPL